MRNQSKYHQRRQKRRAASLRQPFAPPPPSQKVQPARQRGRVQIPRVLVIQNFPQ
jgi:hypothetical protein